MGHSKEHCALAGSAATIVMRIMPSTPTLHVCVGAPQHRHHASSSNDCMSFVTVDGNGPVLSAQGNRAWHRHSDGDFIMDGTFETFESTGAEPVRISAKQAPLKPDGSRYNTGYLEDRWNA